MINAKPGFVFELTMEVSTSRMIFWLQRKPPLCKGSLETAAHLSCPLYRGLDARKADWGLLQISNCIVHSEKLLIGQTLSQLR